MFSLVFQEYVSGTNNEKIAIYDPNPDIFLAYFHKPVTFPFDALTTRRVRFPNRRLRVSFWLSLQGDADMKTNSSLNHAMFNFAFTGVMPPHRRIEDERPTSPLSRFIPFRKRQDA